MEENPCEAVLVNVTGTRQVADMAVKYGAEKMIMVSTDKAVNPTNVMGCSKRLAEIYVQSLSYAIKEGKVKGCTKFVTTRFGNVLGSNGSVIPRFKEQIENGVQANYVNFLTSFTDLRTQEKSVELADQNYNITSNRYKNDLALLTDMLDASNMKLSADLNLVNARINVIYSYYKMKYITHTL